MAIGAVRVIQLNAGSLLEPDWPDRRHEIVAWLRRLRPDVVCLQEIWQDERTANTAGWIAHQMPDVGWHWWFEGRPLGEGVWPDPALRFGSAVLSRWPFEAGTYYRLPVVDDGDQFVATVPWELIHVRTAGLDVFCCHLAAAPRHGHHRKVQVLAIDEIISNVRSGLDAIPAFGQSRVAMPPILCGDFNAEPDSDEIRFLCSLAVLGERTAYYQDAWRVAGDGPGYTQDWRINPLAALLNVPRKRIDYVFVGDPFQRQHDAGRILAAQLAFHEPLTGILASDHAGLAVDIVWPDRPA